MKAVKRMLLGIFFVLLGIFCTLFSVSFSGFELLELVALFSPLLGLGLVLFGFFPRIDLYFGIYLFGYLPFSFLSCFFFLFSLLLWNFIHWVYRPIPGYVRIEMYSL